jgi:hypothetical protein
MQIFFSLITFFFLTSGCHSSGSPNKNNVDTLAVKEQMLIQSNLKN